MRTSFKYLIAFTIGLLLMGYAIKAAYLQRQYLAVGGEFLIPFLSVTLVALWEELNGAVRNIGRQAPASEIFGHKKSTHQSAQGQIISLN